MLRHEASLKHPGQPAYLRDRYRFLVLRHEASLKPARSRPPLRLPVVSSCFGTRPH